MKQIKRVLAFIGVVLLLALYAAAFVSAFIKSPMAAVLFRGAIGSTIILPVFLYLILMVARVLQPRKSGVVDVIVFSDEHIFRDDDGSELYYAAEWKTSLKRAGYKIFDLKADEPVSSILSLAKEARTTPERCLFIDTDKEKIAAARQAGCSAIVFQDPVSCAEQMAGIGIRLP